MIKRTSRREDQKNERLELPQVALGSGGMGRGGSRSIVNRTALHSRNNKKPRTFACFECGGVRMGISSGTVNTIGQCVVRWLARGGAREP
jgi:hypothetical protein